MSAATMLRHMLLATIERQYANITTFHVTSHYFRDYFASLSPWSAGHCYAEYIDRYDIDIAATIAAGIAITRDYAIIAYDIDTYAG